MKRWKLWVLGLLGALILSFLAAAGFLYHSLTRRVVGQYVEVNGVRLHYTDEGSGEPVILVHGFASNADLNWRLPGIHRRLASHFRVIAIDLRGHGLSDKPHTSEAYGLEMVEDIAALMDQLGIQRAHLVGYSLGGFLSLKFAVMHPERVRTLSVLGAGWVSPEEKDFQQALESIARRLRAGQMVGPLSAVQPEARNQPGLLHRAFVMLMTGYFNDPLALASVVEALPEIAVSREELGLLNAPICVIIGERDPLRERAENLCANMPCTFVLIPRVDHITAPFNKAFQDSLEAFLLSHKEVRP
jgi:pimeloyl-ACP methyl ester carboxylesterase